MRAATVISTWPGICRIGSLFNALLPVIARGATANTTPLPSRTSSFTLGPCLWFDAAFAGALHAWFNFDTGLALATLTLWLYRWADATDLTPFLLLADGLAAGDAVGLHLGVRIPFSSSTVHNQDWLSAWSLSRSPIEGCGCPWWCWPPDSPAPAGVDAERGERSAIVLLTGNLAGDLIWPLSAAMLLAQPTTPQIRLTLRVAGCAVAALGLARLALQWRGGAAGPTKALIEA